MLGLNVIIAVVSVLGLLVFASLYMGEHVRAKSLQNTVEAQKSTITEQTLTLANLETEMNKLSEVAVTLDEQNTNLVATLKAEETELEELKERKELYDKYEYALVRSDGSRTDIDYEDIKSLEELAKEKGLGEDAVSVVLAIARNESEGFADVKNDSSSAAGLCGLLSSTAKFSYEKLMDNGRGSYKSDYVYDSLTNLEMAMEYIAYLKDNTSSNRELLVAYRGDSSDEHWFRRIQRYTGKSIDALDL